MFVLLVIALVLASPFADATCDRDATGQPDQPEGNFGQPEPVIASHDDDLTSHPCSRPCGTTGPMTCNYEWVVEWVSTMSPACSDCPCNTTACSNPDCVAADGVPRIIITANRQIPGPAIEVCEGDRVVVEVVNDMVNGEGTSIHWHGMYQLNTVFMDGVSMLTQCPISSHATYRYDFLASPAGTHWWHGHTALQRTDGLYGWFIVRQTPENNLHSALYDHEYVVIVTDWGHEPNVKYFGEDHYRDMTIPSPSILINGKAQFAAYVDSETNATHVTPRQVFEVEQGLRYRFRLIIAEFQPLKMELAIEGHNMSLIASDGYDVEPVEVTSITGHSGERYDFILDANQPVDNYWMWIPSPTHFTVNQGLAIIRYKGAPAENPSSDPSLLAVDAGLRYQPNNLPTSEEVMTVDQLQSLKSPVLPQDGKRTLYMNTDFNQFSDPKFWMDVYNPALNNRAFKFRSYALASQYDDVANEGDLCDYESAEWDQTCAEAFCSCTQVVQVELNQTVEIVLIDEGKLHPAIHPFHLHGHAFYVLAQKHLGDETSVEMVKQMDQDGEIVRNFVNPPLKDTVMTPNAGYTVIQFVANNPGWWFFHCHSAFHLQTGLAVVIRVGSQSDMPPTPTNFPRCGDFTEPTYDVDPTDSTDSTDPTDSPPSTSKTSTTVIVLGVVVGVLSLIVIALVLVVDAQRTDRELARMQMTAPANRNGLSGRDAPWSADC